MQKPFPLNKKKHKLTPNAIMSVLFVAVVLHIFPFRGFEEGTAYLSLIFSPKVSIIYIFSRQIARRAFYVVENNRTRRCTRDFVFVGTITEARSFDCHDETV